MAEADPIKVRLIGEPSRQLAGAVATVAFLVVVAMWTRRRHYGPLVATRTARKLRQIAQRIEDVGLDIARRDTP